MGRVVRAIFKDQGRGSHEVQYISSGGPFCYLEKRRWIGGLSSGDSRSQFRFRVLSLVLLYCTEYPCQVALTLSWPPFLPRLLGSPVNHCLSSFTIQLIFGNPHLQIFLPTLVFDLNPLIYTEIKRPLELEVEA